MKMAKASEDDINMAMELCSALESLTQRWFPTVPEKIEKLICDEERENLNLEDSKQCQRVLRYLLELANSASIFRVVYGCAVMLDPVNKCVDPGADTLEHHPDVIALEKAKTAQSIDEWNEDMGNVLWWRFPVEEPPYCGSPLDSDWPCYHTHWTPLVIPDAPSDSVKIPANYPQSQ